MKSSPLNPNSPLPISSRAAPQTQWINQFLQIEGSFEGVRDGSRTVLLDLFFSQVLLLLLDLVLGLVLLAPLQPDDRNDPDHR